jgi:alpha-L-fucosidase 2
VPLIRLLPTLPPAWVKVGGAGHVTGLRARGGFTISIAWDTQGKLTEASIEAELGGSAYVTVGTNVIGSASGNGTMLKVEGMGQGVFLRLDAEKGVKYSVGLA